MKEISILIYEILNLWKDPFKVLILISQNLGYSKLVEYISALICSRNHRTKSTHSSRLPFRLWISSWVKHLRLTPASSWCWQNLHPQLKRHRCTFLISLPRMDSEYICDFLEMGKCLSTIKCKHKMIATESGLEHPRSTQNWQRVRTTF